MRQVNERGNHSWMRAGAALLVVAAVAGCIGPLAGNRQTAMLAAVREGFEGEPDNCTKCHLAWAYTFDYYRGWDRYGYIFGDSNLAGFYDPWTRGDVANSFREYYATDWWETPASGAWPDDIEARAASMSVLARREGLPRIPKSPEEVDGPVIVVALDGSGDTTSIQRAVDRAEAGTTVFVRPGTYNEVVVLKDGVSLVGGDAETTIINPLNEGHAVTAANHSLIAGLTLTGTGIDYDTLTFNAAIYAAGVDSTSVIMGNIFRENGLFGVWIDGTPDVAANEALRDTYGPLAIERQELVYTDYPNPIICGNTFYRIGQRGVFCVHARGEVFNNIFSGNVKALGLERHSRPYIHHNVFFHNNVPMAVNTSEPLIVNNVFYKNQWGQRMLRGANPVIFGNVTFESPFFRDFGENGLPRAYDTVPGTGERRLDPRFSDPLAGDFSFVTASPLARETTGFAAAGIMRDRNLPQPPIVEGSDSWGREVLSLNEDIVELTGMIDEENHRIRTLAAAYTITYRDYLTVTPGEYGDPEAMFVADVPQVEVTYRVPSFSLTGNRRTKEYTETRTEGGRTTTDSGRITFDGDVLDADGGRFAALYDGTPDPLFIGERPYRETPGGFYRDYDQYVKGACGLLGTFYQGMLHIMGGIILEQKMVVNGNECIVVRYPHIGKDQYYLFYLDPDLGYRPRKIEQYHREALARVMDDYEYATVNGVSVPLHVSVTDYAVNGPDAGAVAAEWQLEVDEGSVKVGE